MKLWEVYIIEYTTVVIEKKIWKLLHWKQIPAGKKKYIYICPDVVYNFTGFMTESIKENRKEIVDMEKKLGVNISKIRILEEFKS